MDQAQELGDEELDVRRFVGGQHRQIVALGAAPPGGQGLHQRQRIVRRKGHRLCLGKFTAACGALPFQMIWVTIWIR